MTEARRPEWAAVWSMLSDLGRSIEGIAERRQRMAEVRGSGQSEDGLISAVVGPHGSLVELRIDPRVYRKPDSAALAASITQAVGAAAAEAVAQERTIVTESVPPDLRNGAIEELGLGWPSAGEGPRVRRVESR